MDVLAFVFGVTGTMFGSVGMVFAMSAMNKLKELDARITAIDETS